MSQEENNIIERIISLKDNMPAKQRKLSDYILENYQDIGLYTVKELAEKAGVGTTTVLRLMKFLGYDSFFELKKEFHDIQKEYNGQWDNVQKSFGNNADHKEFKTLSDVWEESIHMLNQSLSPQLAKNFYKAMDLIEHASRINLLGLRPYKGIAIYLELLIEEFHSNTRQLSYDSESMFDRILQFEKDEVMIIFGFSLYTQRTIDAAVLAHKRGIPIVLITDQLSSPIAVFADVILRIEPSEKHFTVVPIIALVEAIVIELGKRQSKTSVKRIRTLFETLKEMDIIVDEKMDGK